MISDRNIRFLVYFLCCHLQHIFKLKRLQDSIEHFSWVRRDDHGQKVDSLILIHAIVTKFSTVSRHLIVFPYAVNLILHFFNKIFMEFAHHFINDIIIFAVCKILVYYCCYGFQILRPGLHLIKRVIFAFKQFYQFTRICQNFSIPILLRKGVKFVGLIQIVGPRCDLKEYG